MKPTKECLENLYITEKKSPKIIAQIFQVHERTIRDYMMEYNIPRLGPAHLRGGVSATWNIGVKRSAESIEKNRLAHVGKPPHNLGKGRKVFNCYVCGVEVWDKPYRKKHTCSAECKNKMMSVLRGEAHWNYNPETQGIQRGRLLKAYKEWRNDILRRDNYTCQKCHKTSSKFCAHHIDSFSQNPEQRLDISNGICFCDECHLLFHRTFGFKDATADMLKMFLVTM